MMARILVTEELAPRGLDALAEAGHEVDVQLGLDPAGLLAAVAGAEALIIRSATQVTADVMDAGTDLVVVGRAGIGLDNVDVPAATRRGIMVVNAPQSNILSAAEHTIALLLAQARNIPQAHAALKAGKWERSRWEGVELHGKTLGVVGLGRIGTLVAQRALAFGMHLMAYDPFVSPDRARQLGIDLADSLEDLVAEADFLTIHVSKTPETMGLIDADLLAKARPGLRIVNTARGGIVDEQALADAVSSGLVASAGLDVFAKEPTTESPLFGLDHVVVTPHLGASTAEAQDKAGVTYAVKVSAAEASETVRPFLPLAERLGCIFGALNEGTPPVLEVEYQGGLADYDTSLLTLSVLKGLLSAGSHLDPVSYVNAPQLAAERGLEWKESRTSVAHDHVNLIVLRGGHHSVAGTLTGIRFEPRIVMVDDHPVDVPPARHMLVVRNDDRVGMAALVTGAVAEAGVNLADMALGRSPSGDTALMVLATDTALPEEAVGRLRTSPGILDVHTVSL
jgi:D-3-phosphoglycerate dehydrogenase